jgi:hypothetical protein
MCFVRVPHGLILAQSADLACPSCHAPLELSRPSRVLAAFSGLFAAYVAVRLVFGREVRGSWALGLMAAVLAFGAGSALTLFFFSDLTVRPKEVEVFPHPTRNGPLVLLTHW